MKAPHKDLRLDKEAMAKLPESKAGTPLWTKKKVVSPQPPQMELVEKKAHFCSSTRNCPVHGEVSVRGRHHAKRTTTSVESLSCGHTLLICRLVGGLKSLNVNRNHPSSYEHRGWLFTFKNTFYAS